MVSWRRLWPKRVALALAFAVLAHAAIIGATLYRLPWRLFGRPEISGFAVVSRRGELFWRVDVQTFGRLETLVTAAPATTFDAAQRRVESSYEAMEQVGQSMGVRRRILLPQRLPGWFTVAGHDPTPYRLFYRPDKFVYDIHIRAVGWPLRCVWGEQVWAAVLSDRESEGHAKAQQVQWSRGQLKFSEDAFPLPFFPIWSGLAIDVLAFALPFLGLQSAAGAWRSARRRRRGRCAACNYDKAGLHEGAICPECGEQV